MNFLTMRKATAGAVALGHQVHQFAEVLLGKVVAGEDDLGGVARLAQLLGEIVGEGLDGAAGAEVGASDADDDGEVDALGLPVGLDGLELLDQALRNVYGKCLPAKEVVACAGLAFEHVESLQGLVHKFFVISFFHEGGAASQIKFYHGVIEIRCLFRIS